MSNVEYLDSSALGMMLLMRERAEIAGKKIVINGVSPFVVAILKTANFEKLFEITD
jgi:anti-anti-sigma factor